MCLHAQLWGGTWKPGLSDFRARAPTTIGLHCLLSSYAPVLHLTASPPQPQGGQWCSKGKIIPLQEVLPCSLEILMGSPCLFVRLFIKMAWAPRAKEEVNGVLSHVVPSLIILLCPSRPPSHSKGCFPLKLHAHRLLTLFEPFHVCPLPSGKRLGTQGPP